MTRTYPIPQVPAELKARPLTIYGIEGHLLRRNDVVFQPALPKSGHPSALANQRTLVYFGGDIQNLSHLMDQGDDSVIDHRKWCLEETAMRLSKDFPSCHIVVIKPSRVTNDHISCFDNFVESNFIGIPKHYYHYVALMHLEKLLKTISVTLRNTDPDVLFKMLLRTLEEEKFQEEYKIENCTSWQYVHLPADKKRMLLNWQKKLRLHKYPLTLVAFSKGCVVLNQFLYEFHYARGLEPNHQDSRFIERIRDIYWLDSGNCGRDNVYLTSLGLLRTLAALDIIVHVHVSVYMVEDENRPWIGEQFIEFVNGLTALSGNILYFRHISSTEDLEAHFKVLLQFRNVEINFTRNIKSPKVRRQRILPPILDEPVGDAPAARIRARPRKQPGQSETVAYRLVNSHTHPYLTLEVALQQPGFTHEATITRLSCPQYRNFVSYLPTRYNRSRPSSQMPATSAESPISDQTQSTPVQTTTAAQMPSTPAEPLTSVQTSSPSVVVWSSDLLPQGYANGTPLLLNEASYFLSEEEAISFKKTAYTETISPVVAIPNQHDPLRLHLFMPINATYVPAVYNHHFVVDRKKEKNKGKDLSANEEPPDTDISDSASDVSNPDSDDSDSASDVSNPDSDISDSASDVSNPDSDISDSASDVSYPDSDIPGSADDASASDSDVSTSSGTSNSVNSRSGSRSGVGHTLNTSGIIDGVPDVDVFGLRVASASGLGSHATRVTQLQPNTVEDRPVLSQRATPRSVPIAQPNVSQNQVASSSQDSVAPRAGASGARVRARDVNAEPPCRYNLRKRIKRSYDEKILRIQYQ